MDELQPRLFARAVEIAGGTPELCNQLGIEEHSLRLWMARRARAQLTVIDNAV